MDAFDRGLHELLEDELSGDSLHYEQPRQYNPPHCEQCGARCMWFEVQGKYILHDPVTGDPHRCNFGVTIDLEGLKPYGDGNG
ncbi:MAG TPA: hypothetical protein VN039_03325 [Nitrospira sp.]|nr:hypothetical protein [Nitrospira sp.]